MTAYQAAQQWVEVASGSVIALTCAAALILAGQPLPF